MNGILIVDKPQGFTSQDTISKIKKILNINKIGHAGTLDPLATGVLVVLLGEATKLSDYLMIDDKEYECEIVIGKATDTEDATGQITAIKEVNKLDNVDAVLTSIEGELEQVPPMYSSIHYHGVKLYQLARKGQNVEREARKVKVYNIARTSDISYEDKLAKFAFRARVSKGTYVRTLCVEIGNRLNFPAYMNGLRRTQSGNYRIEEACTLDDLKIGKYKIINMLDIFVNKTIIEVDDAIEKKIKNGLKLEIDCADDIIVFAKNYQLLAIYERDNNFYRAKRVWN